MSTVNFVLGPLSFVFCKIIACPQLSKHEYQSSKHKVQRKHEVIRGTSLITLTHHTPRHAVEWSLHHTEQLGTRAVVDSLVFPKPSDHICQQSSRVGACRHAPSSAAAAGAKQYMTRGAKLPRAQCRQQRLKDPAALPLQTESLWRIGIVVTNNQFHQLSVSIHHQVAEHDLAKTPVVTRATACPTV